MVPRNSIYFRWFTPPRPCSPLCFEGEKKHINFLAALDTVVRRFHVTVPSFRRCPPPLRPRRLLSSLVIPLSTFLDQTYD